MEKGLNKLEKEPTGSLQWMYCCSSGGVFRNMKICRSQTRIVGNRAFCLLDENYLRLVLLNRVRSFIPFYGLLSI